jgi:hypothetical protein
MGESPVTGLVLTISHVLKRRSVILPVWDIKAIGIRALIYSAVLATSIIIHYLLGLSAK